jgi:hypothetical protein
MILEKELENKYVLPDSPMIKELLSEAMAIIAGGDNLFHELELKENHRLFNTKAIKKICLKYRLRCLDISFMKQSLPQEAQEELQYLEQKYGLKFKKLKIIGPSKIFELEQREKDPILLAELDDDKFLFIHKWGPEFTNFRALAALPLRNFTTMVISVGLISMALTSLIAIAHEGTSFLEFLFGVFTIWLCFIIFTVNQSVAFKLYPTTVIWNSKFLD